MRRPNAFSTLGILLVLITGCRSFDRYDERSDADTELRAALSRLDEAREEDRTDVDAWLDLERLALDHPRDPKILFANASYAFEKRDDEKARGYLRMLAEAEPDHPEGSMLAARLAQRDGNLTFAEKLLEQQIRLRPDHPGLRETLGSVHFLQQRWDDARAELLEAERLGAPKWRVAYHLGLVAESSGKVFDATRHYLIAHQTNPADPRAARRLRALGVEPPPTRSN